VLEVLEVLEKIGPLGDFQSMGCFAATTLPIQESIIYYNIILDMNFVCLKNVIY